MVNRPCPVCGSPHARSLHLNRFAALDGLDLSYRLARCTACGFHFANELPQEADYLRYYQTLSKYDSQPSVSALDAQRLKAAAAFMAQARVPRDARIVDLGCGFGAFLSVLREQGWTRLLGIDPAPQSPRQAFEQFGLTCIRQGVLSDPALSDELVSADVVCLMAVVEHLPELRRDLRDLVSRLRPGTRLLIEVPAVDLFEADAGEPYGELSLEHIQFFSLNSLVNLLHGLGARVEHHQLMPVPEFHSGALFMMAELDGLVRPPVPEDPRRMNGYLAGSRRRWQMALDRVPAGAYVLYGAGAQGTRLLAQGAECGAAGGSWPVAVLDGNANLQGKRLGHLTVQTPDALAHYPGLPVLIASYRAEPAISRSLRGRFSNPLVPLFSGQAT